MQTFIQICKENQGHKNQKKVRRWQIYFALNFNQQLKELIDHESDGHGTSGQFMRTQIDFDGQPKNYER